MNILVRLLCCCAFLALLQQCTPSPKMAATAGRRLIWSDEFNQSGLPDSTKWGYDYGNGCPNVCGWGNNELQFYTARRAENGRVENGHLIIEARREKWEKNDYTSARIVSKYKGDWTYGRIEARLKCPVGRGTWPAFWMLSTDWKYGGWPRSGEIDIMEHVGFMPDSVFGSAHTETFNHVKHTQSTSGYYVPDAEQKFHVYAVEWYPDRIDYFVDAVKYHTFTNRHKTPDEWPFDQRFHVILNMAVGGNWGAVKGVDESIWPRRMEVDYVRVYAFDTKK